MVYRLLADAVLVLHAGFVAFVVVGLILFLVGGALGWNWVRNVWLRVAHLAAIVVVVAQAWAGVECPLTTVESRLRVAAGQDPYEPGGFIASWLHRVVFFEVPPSTFAVIYTLFALLVVATLVWVPPRWRAARRGAGPGADHSSKGVQNL